MPKAPHFSTISTGHAQRDYRFTLCRQLDLLVPCVASGEGKQVVIAAIPRDRRRRESLELRGRRQTTRTGDRRKAHFVDRASRKAFYRPGPALKECCSTGAGDSAGCAAANACRTSS